MPTVQKVETVRTDDLDGSAADSTIRFGLDGAEYEIDLNDEHANTFRESWRSTSRPRARSAVPAAVQARASAGLRIRCRCANGPRARACRSRSAAGCQVT